MGTNMIVSLYTNSGFLRDIECGEYLPVVGDVLVLDRSEYFYIDSNPHKGPKLGSPGGQYTVKEIWKRFVLNEDGVQVLRDIQAQVEPGNK